MTPELREKIKSILSDYDAGLDIKDETINRAVHWAGGRTDPFHWSLDRVNDPRLWVLLVHELLGRGYCITESLCGLAVSHECTGKMIVLPKDKREHGLIICIVYLKMKLQEP